MQEAGITRHQRLKELIEELKEMSEFTLDRKNMNVSYKIDTDRMGRSYKGWVTLSDGSLPGDVGDITSIEEEIFRIKNAVIDYEEYVKMVIPENMLAGEKEIAELVYKYFSSGIKLVP